MKLYADSSNGIERFIFECPFEKKHLAEAAGFRRVGLQWITSDPATAANLSRYADEALRRRLDAIAAQKAHRPTLLLENGRYVFRADKDLIGLARDAGFFKDPALDCWYTYEPDRAITLAQYGDEILHAQIKEQLAGLDRVLASSRALAADIQIPRPPGRDYFPHQYAAVAYAKRVLRIGDPTLNGDPIPGMLLGDEMRVGKGGVDSTKILTPTGWITFADVEVGDRVIGSDGTAHTVIGVYPRGVQDVFRVTFNDGASVLCDGEHLWHVTTAQGRYNESFERVISTREIFESPLHANGSRKNAVNFIPVLSAPAKLEGIGDLPLDPYFLGALLGDGSIVAGTPGFTTADEEMVDLLRASMPVGVQLKRRRDERTRESAAQQIYFSRMRQKTNPLVDALKYLKLLGHRAEGKYVPEVYKWAPAAEREALLQGLLDTDGSTNAVGLIEFVSVSRQLREDVVFLVQSLGGTATRSEKDTFYTDRKGQRVPCKRAYRTNIVLPEGINAFRLKRKADRWHAPKKFIPARSIKKIEPAGRENVTCIRVDSPDSLYLTDEFIVTHNTPSAIGVINLASDQIRKVLVVCPAGVKLGWYRELTAWLVNPRKLLIADSATSRWKFEAADISIVNFDVLKDHVEWIRKRGSDGQRMLELQSLGRLDVAWDLVIIDEAHLLKNPQSQRSIVGYALLERAKRKLCLTGTPITNWIDDLFPLLHALDPMAWPSLARFRARYGTGKGAKNLDDLKKKLRSSIMCRRLLREVQPGLPPKMRDVLEISADDAVAIRAIQREAAAWERQQARLVQLQAAAELSKASDDPKAFSEANRQLGEGKRVAFSETAKLRHETALVKVPYVVNHLKSLIEDPAYKIVVGAWHSDVIEKLSAPFGNRAVTVTGAVSADLKTVNGRETSDRMLRVDRFLEDPQCQIFFGNLVAAGMGLNLSSASHIVCAELWYVPWVMQQFEARCEHPTKKSSIFVQHLVLAGSIDANIARALVEKQAVIDKALDGAEGDAKQEVSPLDEPATAQLTPAMIQKAAGSLSPSEIVSIHREMKKLIKREGLNRVDAEIAKVLGRLKALTDRQAVLGRAIAERYQ